MLKIMIQFSIAPERYKFMTFHFPHQNHDALTINTVTLLYDVVINIVFSGFKITR